MNDKPITVVINGTERVIPDGAMAYKHAESTDVARWLYDEEAIEAVRRKDPSLLVEWNKAQVVSLSERRAKEGT